MSWTDPWAYTDGLDDQPAPLEGEAPADRANFDELRLVREQARITQGTYERLIGERIVRDRTELELKGRIDRMVQRKTLSLSKK